jgi:flavin-binding protein dodecin
MCTRQLRNGGPEYRGEAAKTIRDIVGVEVVGWTCKVEHGKVVQYRTTCKLAFRVESDRE